MPANTIITVRKGTASQWSSSNSVLASGEPGYDLSNNILKIGDGVSNWNNLKNVASISGLITASSGNFNSLSVSGISVSTNNHIHGNISSSGTIGSISGVLLSTSSNGLITTISNSLTLGSTAVSIGGTYLSISGLTIDGGNI
jgi:hypothetical protein